MFDGSSNITSWSIYSGTIYQASVVTPLAGLVTEDNIALTFVAWNGTAFPYLPQGSYTFDYVNQIVYIRTISDDSPAAHQLTVCYWSHNFTDETDGSQEFCNHCNWSFELHHHCQCHNQKSFSSLHCTSELQQCVDQQCECLSMWWSLFLYVAMVTPTD